MKEAFTIYVEDDEELVYIQGYFGVKKKDGELAHLRRIDICPSEMKEHEGVLATVDKHDCLLVKDGEC